MPDMKLVVVAGDAAIDWCLTGDKDAEDLRGAKWNAQKEVELWPLHGGSLLLYDLMHYLIEGVGGLAPLAGDPGEEPNEDPEFTKYHHAYVRLRKCDNRWRVDQMLGIRKRLEECPNIHTKAHEHLPITGDAANAALVVLNDASLDFTKAEDHWPQAIHKGTPWVVLKLGGRNMADGALLKKVLDKHCDRLVVVTTANDLREYSQIEISKELSWERTAEECANVLERDEKVKALTKCNYVVISFGPCGALLFERDTSANSTRKHERFTLFFDPLRMEDNLEYTKHGEMWGYTSILTAAIAREVLQHLLSDGVMDMERGIQAGLTTMKEAYNWGFGPHWEGDKGKSVKHENSKIDFPKKQAAETIKELLLRPSKGFATTDFKLPPETASADKLWTILQQKITTVEAAEKVAERYVLKGDKEEVLEVVPQGHYGKLFTVDRREIESFESVKALIREYVKRTATDARKARESAPEGREIPKPLSVAVFGAPGDGKSFAVKAIMNSLALEGAKLEEFNLSQFTEVLDLENAFHVIRDRVLAGILPFVLWDEFDTRFNGDLGWLRYFLSPMEDGKFQQGETIHPIGRSIFVFAGGTSCDLQEFEKQPDFTMAKGRDFLSRVSGHIDLQGTNPNGDDYHYYVIRRAILLRSFLESKLKIPDETLDDDFIDLGVLRAFLKVEKYKHGARSMRAILNACALSGKHFFGRSSLPAEAQLNLHVSGDFRDKLQR